MTGETLTMSAVCTGCDDAYTVELSQPSGRVRSAHDSNRTIWMQSHADRTGHPRFYVSECRSRHVINRCNPELRILELSDDPLYETFRVGGEVSE